MPINPNEIFPLVEFHGRTARERGHEHGSLLADRITRSIAFYQEQFTKQPRYSETFVLNLCEQYRRGIAAFSSEYLEELDSIAIASQQDPLSIVMLNCRLELLSHLAAGVQNECTVLYDARTCQLGENWDWAECFEQLAFVNRLTHNRILQINEPGVLAKIGFNAHGIGVTINFVDPRYQPKNPSNVPLHILLRTVLDRAETLEQATKIFEEHGPGFGGHTLVGDDQGQCCCVEFPGDHVRLLPNHSFHTNHFLFSNDTDYMTDKSRLQNSLDRYARVTDLWKNKQTETTIKTILLDYDDQHQTYPICRIYKPTYIGPVGTVCSVIMNLKERTLEVTKGNPRRNSQYFEFKL